MIVLMIGRAGSRGFPGKNTKKIMLFVRISAIMCKKSKFVEKIYVSTDDQKLKKLQKNMMLNLSKDQKNLITAKHLATMYSNLDILK